MSLHSVAKALSGMGPVLEAEGDSDDFNDANMGMHGLLVSSFELRYSLLRGKY